MGKIGNSGLYNLKDCFRESLYGITQQTLQLRAQLQARKREYAVAREKATPGIWLIVCEIAIAVFLSFIIIQKSDGYENPLYAYQALAVFTVAAIAVGLIGITYNFLLIAPVQSQAELRQLCNQLRSNLSQKEDEYKETILDRLKNSAAKRDELARMFTLGNGKWLFFCSSFIAMLDFSSDEMFLLKTTDCRELQLSYKEIQRVSRTSGTISSRTGQSLAGGAIGELVFGGAGFVVGSIVGSAGGRSISMSSIETSIGKYLVDVYTRLQEFPVVTLDFDIDETQAKEFYAVIKAALPNST